MFSSFVSANQKCGLLLALRHPPPLPAVDVCAPPVRFLMFLTPPKALPHDLSSRKCRSYRAAAAAGGGTTVATNTVRQLWNLRSLILDVSLKIRFLPYLHLRWSRPSNKLSAVMYVKAVFFAVALALIGAAAAADSGKFSRPLVAELAAASNSPAVSQTSTPSTPGNKSVSACLCGSIFGHCRTSFNVAPLTLIAAS